MRLEKVSTPSRLWRVRSARGGVCSERPKTKLDALAWAEAVNADHSAIRRWANKTQPRANPPWEQARGPRSSPRKGRKRTQRGQSPSQGQSPSDGVSRMSTKVTSLRRARSLDRIKCSKPWWQDGSAGIVHEAHHLRISKRCGGRNRRLDACDPSLQELRRRPDRRHTWEASGAPSLIRGRWT